MLMSYSRALQMMAIVTAGLASAVVPTRAGGSMSAATIRRGRRKPRGKRFTRGVTAIRRKARKKAARRSAQR